MLFFFFSDISDRNNDYSDTMDCRRALMGGGGHVFRLGGPWLQIPWAAHSQDFGGFNFIDLLSIFNSRNHPLGVATCKILFFQKNQQLASKAGIEVSLTVKTCGLLGKVMEWGARGPVLDSQGGENELIFFFFSFKRGFYTILMILNPNFK